MKSRPLTSTSNFRDNRQTRRVPYQVPGFAPWLPRTNPQNLPHTQPHYLNAHQKPRHNTFLPQNPWPGLCLLIWPVDQAIENWGSANISFIKDGVRRAGYAIVSNYSIKAAQSLPPNTSARKAELIALMWALIPREGKIIDNTQIQNMPSFYMPHRYLEIEKTSKCKKFPCKMWGWDSTSHRSDSKTKTCSRHSLPWAPTGNFSNFLRKWQGWLGSEQSTLMSVTKMALILSLTPSNVIPKYSILKRPRHETGAGAGGGGN